MILKFIKNLKPVQWIAVALIVFTLILAAVMRSVEPLFFTVLLGMIIYWEEMLKECKDCPTSDTSSPTDFF